MHSLKVSQLEKESQEQRERCKMLSAELENANTLKDVLEETVLQWKSFGTPECDVEVHATDSGHFLPPTYLPMTPRNSNTLNEAKDVPADGPADASTTIPNRWGRKRGERRKLGRRQGHRRFARQPRSRRSGDVESLNKASTAASDMDAHSGAPDVATPERSRGDRIKTVPSIDQTARWQCWEWIRIPANRVVPFAFRPSPSGWND